MEKFVFFVFQGDVMCFVHVLLNALDMQAKKIPVKIVLEGQAVKLVKELEEKDHPIFKKAKEALLFDSICRACSVQLGVLEYNEQCGIPLSDELKGHPAMTRFVRQGYSILPM